MLPAQNVSVNFADINFVVFLFCALGIKNTELHDLRIITCLRKSEVTVEGISVCNDIEKSMEHGIRYLPCSYIKCRHRYVM